MARILLIDDEEVVRRGMGRTLRTLGHDVVEVANGRDGLRALQEGGIDLVVTDINMPDTDGIEVIMAIRQSGVPTPVIAMSGGGKVPKDVLLDSAELLGAVACLAKPFELAELRAILDEVLGDGP